MIHINAFSEWPNFSVRLWGHFVNIQVKIEVSKLYVWAAKLKVISKSEIFV